MNVLKKIAMMAIIAVAATTAFTGCKKDDVTPIPAKNHQLVTMDSGSEQPPQPPPPPPSIP